MLVGTLGGIQEVSMTFGLAFDALLLLQLCYSLRVAARI